MLTIGLNHVATLTNDSHRLHAFYEEVFEAEVVRDAPEVEGEDAVRLSMIRIGPYAELNVFQIEGNTEADRQVPMFGRGRIDRFALQAGSLEDFETIRRRLMDRGSCDAFVTDFGPVLSLFFHDPDGLEGEVCVVNPHAIPGVTHPPGTPALRYAHRTGSRSRLIPHRPAEGRGQTGPSGGRCAGPADSRRGAARSIPGVMNDPARRDGPHYRGPDRLLRCLALLGLLWGLVYLVWRAWDTGQGAQPVMFWLLYASEVFGLVMLASFSFLAWRVPLTHRPAIGWRPTADVFVCTYDEGLDVLGATLVGCDRISYPHTTWVLDDGRRREVRQLAERFGANYLSRTTNEHAKAGNINHALSRTGGQLILILDADHVPQPDILDATVGYFDDPAVALVQTPHDFGNHDSFQHFETGRHDQSMFFEVLMPARTATTAPSGAARRR